MKIKFILWALALAPLLWNCQKKPDNVVSLAGQWKFSLDTSNVGTREAWYNKALPQTITLPGSLTENGYGEEPSLETRWVGSLLDSSWFKSPRYAKYREPGNLKLPMWLTPVKYYRGVAWYQREIEIPASWENVATELFLERCHWETQVWVDDKKLGTQNALGTPHVYDLGALSPGKHLVTIRVDNDLIVDVGVNSHSVSDHTQTNWNGIVGRIELRARPKQRLESLALFPDVTKKQVQVRAHIKNQTNQPFSGKLILSATSSTGNASPEVTAEVTAAPGSDTLFVDYNLQEDIELWSEFNPVTYTLKATLLNAEGQVTDTLTDSFGLRKLEVKGRSLELNGKPLFLRGTLECAIFPLTGYPPVDKAYWQKIFTTSRNHGLNHIRFHSWCPPEIAFQVADEMGFYLQVECSSWANQSTTIGDGKPVDQFVIEESKRIVSTYGNHPSFCLMAYGNEPGGLNHKTYLAKFETYWKNKDNRRVYTSGAGWPILPENDYHNSPEPRIQRWNEGLNSIINAEPPRTDYDWSNRISDLDKPMVSHEIGQWCVYPNFKEIPKYSGVLKPKNFEMFKETLEENHLGHLADDFLMASGKLQTLCYKADIEAALRTPGFGGFQLLDLHDFPGQGTALVGVLDPFWDSKGYVTPAEYKRFCAETVPLARMPKLVLQQQETFKADVEFAHFGEEPFANATVYWKLTYSGAAEPIAEGKWENVSIPLGNNHKTGSVAHALHDVKAPAKLKFTVGIAGTEYENDWDIWVYPDRLRGVEPQDVVVTASWTAASAALDKGRKVLFMVEKGKLKPETGGDVAVGFSSIFWNTSWTRNQPPHTLGILCDPEHPVFKDFPTDFHSNWPWWELTKGVQTMVLDGFPASLDPTVKMIDTWFKNRRLALLFEAKVGQGKLMVCSMDLENVDERPVARQLRHSVLNYMSTDQFNPTVAVRADDIANLMQ